MKECLFACLPALDVYAQPRSNFLLAGGNEYEYPPWIRSLALRIRRERKKATITQLNKASVQDRASKIVNKPTDLLRCIRYHPNGDCCNILPRSF